MTVAHKDLTGTDLHEVKGASTATAGQVPVSDGAGGAPFAKLTHTSLETTGNPFGAQLLHLQERRAGDSTSTQSSAGFTVQVLDTVVTNEITGASLAANLITLPAGTYYCEGSAVANVFSQSSSVAMNQSELYNSTTANQILVGQISRAVCSSPTSSVGIQEPSRFSGRFTLAGSTGLYVRQLCTGSSIQSGKASGSGVDIYADIKIWKIA